jgi:hypothetical protein
MRTARPLVTWRRMTLFRPSATSLSISRGSPGTDLGNLHRVHTSPARATASPPRPPESREEPENAGEIPVSLPDANPIIFIPGNQQKDHCQTMSNQSKALCESS